MTRPHPEWVFIASWAAACIAVLFIARSPKPKAMIHVYPQWEAEQHELEGTCCPCGPAVDWSLPEAVVTHRALSPPPSDD